MDLFDLSGHKAIVTGGTRGLGHAMAEALMEAGAETVIFGTSLQVFAAAEKFCARGFRCNGVQVDLGDRSQIRPAFEKALALLGGDLQILVNCAGIIRRSPCSECSAEDWEDVLNVNLTAPFVLSQLASGVMIQNGYGKIVMLSSMIGFFGGKGIPSYAASKGGVNQITKAMANDWADKGLNVNAIAPGYMLTEINAAHIAEGNPRFEQFLARIPQKRWGTVEDVKGACIFLSSHASDYLNGAIIPVDGGYLIG